VGLLERGVTDWVSGVLLADRIVSVWEGFAMLRG
jgi:hypothetical protein